MANKKPHIKGQVIEGDQGNVYSAEEVAFIKKATQEEEQKQL